MSLDPALKSTSKFLSYVLRHHPESIGVEMDDHGWVTVSELIEKANKSGRLIDRQTIHQLIENNAKQRFILSDDENFIRAGYGHSVNVDLQLHPPKPPQTLFHGTAAQNIDSILDQGIHSASRNFVHLSMTQKEAQNVGSRHGKPAILTVAAQAMYDNGYTFYQSDSEAGIWLVKYVPAEYVDKEHYEGLRGQSS